MSYFPFFVKNDNFFWLLLDTGGKNHGGKTDTGNHASSDL